MMKSLQIAPRFGHEGLKLASHCELLALAPTQHGNPYDVNTDAFVSSLAADVLASSKEQGKGCSPRVDQQVALGALSQLAKTDSKAFLMMAKVLGPLTRFTPFEKLSDTARKAEANLKDHPEEMKQLADGLATYVEGIRCLGTQSKLAALLA
jgi:hypothetical protein